MWCVLFVLCLWLVVCYCVVDCLSFVVCCLICGLCCVLFGLRSLLCGLSFLFVVVCSSYVCGWWFKDGGMACCLCFCLWFVVRCLWSVVYGLVLVV